MTLGQLAQPEIHDQWPARSIVEPMAIEPDPNPVMSDDRDRGSTAQKDQLPLHERRGRAKGTLLFTADIWRMSPLASVIVAIAATWGSRLQATICRRCTARTRYLEGWFGRVS